MPDPAADLPIPDEPPPAYELLDASPSHNPGSSSSTSNIANNGTSTSVSTHNTGASTNPFLNTSNKAQSTSNPFADPSSTASTSQPAASSSSASAAPVLPPRNYSNNNNSSSTTVQQAPLSPVPTGTHASPASPGRSSFASRPSIDHNRPSVASRPSPPSSPSTTASPSSSTFRPPAGPPPSQHAPPTSPPPSSQHYPPPASPSSSASANYRPTTVPTPGQPLLRKGKLLLYPANWAGCHKCGDTGYKQGDPSNPCKKCWDKYGKTYSGALSYSVGLNQQSYSLQKPLPVMTGAQGGYYPPPSSQAHRPPGIWPPGPSHGHVPGGYPGVATSPGPWSPPPHGRPPIQPHPGPHVYGARPGAHGPYQPPPSGPPGQGNLDPETEGSRMPDVPPNYNDASNVDADERLPAQYVPPSAPPPGHGPPRPPQSPMHARPPPPPPPQWPPAGSYGPPGGFVGGFSPHGPSNGVFVSHSGMRPPPGALVVMPGDPRIGGRLCYECGGRGVRESFWFGDETCYRCRGSGRVF